MGWSCKCFFHAPIMSQDVLNISSGFFLIVKLMRTFCQQIREGHWFRFEVLIYQKPARFQGSWHMWSFSYVSYVPSPGFQKKIGRTYHWLLRCSHHSRFFRSGLSYIRWKKKTCFHIKVHGPWCFLASKKWFLFKEKPTFSKLFQTSLFVFFLEHVCCFGESTCSNQPFILGKPFPVDHNLHTETAWITTSHTVRGSTSGRMRTLA